MTILQSPKAYVFNLQTTSSAEARRLCISFNTDIDK